MNPSEERSAASRRRVSLIDVETVLIVLGVLALVAFGIWSVS